MADVTINQLANIAPSLDSIIPLSQGGSTYSTMLSQLSTLPFIPKAWVSFDGSRNTSGNVDGNNSNRLIRSSYNVSSVLRNGAGDYSINFASNLADTNYSIFITTNRSSGNTNLVNCARVADELTNPQVNLFRIVHGVPTSNRDLQKEDASRIYCAVFR